MKKNGFTLIELLAVIVTLAIIALIAVPIVLNIIDDSKEASNKRSIDMYAKAIENSILKDMTVKKGKINSGIFKTDKNNYNKLLDSDDVDSGYTIDYKGNKVYCDYIEITQDGEIKLSKCKVGSVSSDYVMNDDTYYSIGNVKLDDLIEVSGSEELVLDIKNEELVDYRIYGNTVETESVGDYDKTTGKYKIPITVHGLNNLKPLRKSTTTTYSGVTQTIDENGVITLNGTSTAVSFPKYAESASFFLPKGTYTLMGNMTGRGVDVSGNEYTFGFFIQESDSGNKVTLAFSSTTPVKFTTTQDWNCIIYVYINKKDITFNNVKYYPILVSGEYNTLEFEPYINPVTTNIYLNEPLRKVGDSKDYIDFKGQRVVRTIKVINNTFEVLKTPTYESISIPNIKLNNGYNRVTVDTKVKPSKITGTYKNN